MCGRSKYLNLVMMFNFLVTSFPLWAQEELVNHYKSGSTQKQKVLLTSKREKGEMVTSVEESGRQNAEIRKEQVPAQVRPRISFDSVKYDAGKVWEGDEVVHTFTVRNVGTGQLTIKNVKPG